MNTEITHNLNENSTKGSTRPGTNAPVHNLSKEPMPLKLTELEQRYTLIVGLLESHLLQFPSLVSLSSLLNHQEHKIKQLYIFIIKTTRVLVIKLLQFLGEKEVQHFMV